MICVITYSMTQRPSNLLPYSNVLHGQSTLNSKYSAKKSNGLLNTLVSSVLVAEDVIKLRKSRHKSLNRSSLSLHTTGTSSTTTGTGRKRRGIEGRESDEISHSSIIKPLKTNQLFNISTEINNNNNICRDNDSVDKKSRKSMLHSFVTDEMYRIHKSVGNNINSSVCNSPSVTGVSLNPFNRRNLNNENNNNDNSNNNVNDNSIIGGKRRLGNIGIDMNAFEDALRQLESDSKSDCSN